MKTEQNKTKCIYPNCESFTYARGLCRKHYIYARHLVITGKTTWEKLEKTGKVLSRKSNEEAYKYFLGKEN